MEVGKVKGSKGKYFENKHRNKYPDLCKTTSARVVASGLWPETQDF